MPEYLLPYLLLMAHFISGGLWLIRITRKLEPEKVIPQWMKYGTYLILVNLLWYCLVCFPWFFPYLCWSIVLLAMFEWWRVIKSLKRRIWVSLAFLFGSAGFIGYSYLDQNRLLFTYFVVVLFDGSCQISGQLFGKRSLLPKISPRKTVEGLAAGILITLATTLLTRKSFGLEWNRLIIDTLILMAAAFMGDLLASAVKRKAKVDTFGKLLPGHGGILDRFDSLMMAGTLTFLYAAIQNWIR